MDDKKYRIWLNSLRWIMILFNIMTKDREICKESFRHYYDDGYTRQQVLDFEFGKEWRLRKNVL